MIRFICKSNFSCTIREDLHSEKIMNNCKIINNSSCDFTNLLDIYSNQQFYQYYKNENGILSKVLIPHVRVRIELEN